jgi:hypothetical protein
MIFLPFLFLTYLILQGYTGVCEALEESCDSAPILAPEKSGTTETLVSAAAADLEPTLVDLKAFGSVEEFEKLGLDRLKGFLIAMGVKCG